MNSLPRYVWPLILGVMLILLTGCTLARANRSGEISAANYVPPPVEEAAGVRQQENTVVRLEPSSTQLEVNNIVDIDILIDNVVDLAAFDIQLSYDPTVVQVRDDDPDTDGVQIRPGDFLSPDFVVDNEADNVTGDIFYAVTQTAPSTPVSGNGRLATARFQAVDQGSSQLIFTVAMFVRVTQTGTEQIPVTAQPGQIIVGQPTGEDTSTPTATASPTATGTTVPGQDTPTPTATGQTVTPPPFTATPTLTPVATFTPLPPPTATPVPLAIVPKLKIPPSATEGFCYRVQKRDTLDSLGRQFGVDPGYLNLVNDLNPPGHTYLHQALFIPIIPGSGPNVYRVKVGDTLNKIADDCNLPADFIAQVNKIEEDTPLFLRQGDTAVREDGSLFTAPEDMVIIKRLIIPRPPFAPPSRYPYPGAVHPPIPPGCNTYPRCN